MLEQIHYPPLCVSVNMLKVQNVSIHFGYNRPGYYQVRVAKVSNCQSEVKIGRYKGMCYQPLAFADNAISG